MWAHKRQQTFYLGDLEVVKLLLPLEDGLQPTQPNIDIAHQHTATQVDGQVVQRWAQVLQ